MRYTTIIDISDIPEIYKNHNTRLVYLHLCLFSSYESDTLDVYGGSIRRLAADVGITVAAVRNSLRILFKYGLLKSTEDNKYIVTKYLTRKEIKTRAKTEKEAKEKEQKISYERRKQQEHEEEERKRKEYKEQAAELAKQNKTPFMAFYEGLQKRYEDGDTSVLRSLKRYRETYEQHKQSFNKG